MIALILSWFLPFSPGNKGGVRGQKLIRILVSATLLAPGLPSKQSPAVPVSASDTQHISAEDSTLTDLISIGRWMGEYTRGVHYRRGDVVSVGARFYLVCRDGADIDGGLEHLPLSPGEEFAFDDEFEGRFQNVPSRHAINSTYHWALTGEGYRQASIRDGYLTAAGNTYFVVGNLPPRISEFGLVVNWPQQVGVSTMALGPEHLIHDFDYMWHVNWGETEVGQTLYWQRPRAALPPPLLFSWNSGARLTAGRDHELVIKLRGKFMFGYVNDEFAFVQVSDIIGAYAARATSIYIQNHPRQAGEERLKRVWIKLRKEP